MSKMELLKETVLFVLKLLWFTLVAFIKFFIPYSPKKDLSKEIVLITGAASGIGRVMALRFADEGACVVLWDLNGEGNEAVAEEIKAKGRKAHAYTCDCSKREEIYRVAEKVKKEVGDVTVLVNNAGIVTGKKFFDSPDNMVDLTFKVNTVAHFWTIKAFVPAMMKNNHGHVITVASGAGLFGVAGLVDYCASKFGAVGIHESLTSELSIMGKDGVHTTVVCPYFIDTGMFDGVKSRFPLLLPIVTPEYAVNKIMSAYHSNQQMLLIPRLIYIFYFLQGILPKSAMLEAGKFFGANTSMESFKGRQKKQD